jgi:hypothetical protein
MSTVADIEKALANLTDEDLRRVEVSLHQLQRKRGVGIIFDDHYGVWTEDDQTSAVAEAWGSYDAAEASPGTK